jgi:hypothetical protein
MTPVREPNRFVQKRSKQDIAHLANLVRSALMLGEDHVAMAPLLELALPELLKDYDFQVVDDDELGGAEGWTDISEPVIRMTNTSYQALLSLDPRARFTAAHELGHLLMHSSSHIHYARAAHMDPQTDPEWQANEFAAAFLMPEKAFRKTTSVEEAMARFGVGYQAARRRARDLEHRLINHKKKGHGMTRAP